jgi:hypothetical protein
MRGSRSGNLPHLSVSCSDCPPRSRTWARSRSISSSTLLMPHQPRRSQQWQNHDQQVEQMAVEPPPVVGGQAESDQVVERKDQPRNPRDDIEGHGGRIFWLGRTSIA